MFESGKNVYSIPDAISFLAKEYGKENMPTSEETIRRAIRSKQILAQEKGDPGRKGYTITEDELRAYASRRMKRVHDRQKSMPGAASVITNTVAEDEPISFPELYSKYLDGEIEPKRFYLLLYREKSKWEAAFAKKQEELRRLEVQRQILENDINTCLSSINAFTDGIEKLSLQ